MKRLGYTRFAAQGGDWGALVVDMMGVQAPPELIGIHTNMPVRFRPTFDEGGPVPAVRRHAGLSDEERDRYFRS